MRYLTRQTFNNPCTVAAGDTLKVTHHLYHDTTLFATGEYDFEALGPGRAIGVEREFEILQNGYDFTVAEPKLIWDVNCATAVILVKDDISVNGVSAPTPQLPLDPITPFTPFDSPTQVCPDCRGKGKIELFTSIEPCNRCHGKGKV